MQQSVGALTTLPVLTSAPSTDGVGLAMSIYSSNIRGPGRAHKRYRVRVDVGGTGTPSVKLQLWTKDMSIASSGGAWGIPYDASGNNAQLGNGATLGAGTYYFVFEDVGVMAEIALVSTTVNGSPTVAAKCTQLTENQETN